MGAVSSALGRGSCARMPPLVADADIYAYQTGAEGWVLISQTLDRCQPVCLHRRPGPAPDPRRQQQICQCPIEDVAERPCEAQQGIQGPEQLRAELLRAAAPQQLG